MSQSLNARAVALASGNMAASTPLSPGMQANFRGFTFVDESSIDDHFMGRDELARMEEDVEDLENEWEDNNRRNNDGRGSDGRGNRMSGIEYKRSHDDESGIFGNDGMDM
jgi:hypothetical protein